jgi:hypothetical protein
MTYGGSVLTVCAGYTPQKIANNIASQHFFILKEYCCAQKSVGDFFTRS